MGRQTASTSCFTRRRIEALPLACVLLTLAIWLGLEPLAQPAFPTPGVPRVGLPESYVGSDACRMCHPGEHDSWHRTYHRTMTRLSGELWAGEGPAPSLPAELASGELRYLVFRDAEGQVKATGPDLHVLADELLRYQRQPFRQTEEGAETTPRSLSLSGRPRLDKLLEGVPEATRALVMVTGSHHYLAFWLAGDEGRELRQLPFVYLLSSEEWAPREEVFLQPPDSLPHLARWNANCVMCHAVAGQPRQSESPSPEGLLVRYETSVAELGIGCEACHGPGGEHSRYYKNPARRWRAEAAPDGREAGGLVNPQKLSAERESAICGQCHAYFVPNEPEAWWDVGFTQSYLPGEDLDASRTVLLPDPAQLRHAGLSRGIDSLFWGDGSIRVGGREYNGLLKSPCYRSSEPDKSLRCTSCHSLHQGTRDDQLQAAIAQDPNLNCTGCHEMEATHSGHEHDSPGSLCVNCHMPKTSYALLQAIRSHRITSPSHQLTDPPSGCVLCHVDRDEQWHHTQLTALFPNANSAVASAVARQAPEATADASEAAFPYGARRALAGNAAERAIFAAHLGSPETLQTVGSLWPRALLEQLADDPYHAVKRIARAALAKLDVSTARPHEGQTQKAAKGASESPLAPAAMLEKIHASHDSTPIVISE